MTPQRTLSYSRAIKEAIDQCLAKDPSVFLIGEGVPDAKGIFGTTVGLAQKYGSQRVMDMPVSENALTGICVGAALRGMRPIITHQRVDFCLLALDQIINNAAKWHFMFGGQSSVPMVIRLIIGRGWGQGPQHSQHLHSIFSHIPGLKVIMPTTAYDVKGMLVAAVEDNNPVICIEHRWLYELEGYVPEEIYRVALDKANIIRPGKDVTIVSQSHMTIEALKAAGYLAKEGIEAEVIDLRTLRPLDRDAIVNSVKKTGRLLVLDTGWLTYGITGEIIASVTDAAFSDLKAPPRRIALPDIPTPTSPFLTKNFYPTFREIIGAVCDILGADKKRFAGMMDADDNANKPHDVPDLSFKGPF